ncbi:MAG: fructose-bisphosphate aldolase [Anaerolineae bacterium]|nr:fructose-bisphosphate aldolase [Anaerolineae bacterium]
MVKRPTLDELDLSLGKRTRLHRLLYEHGPANGTLLLLPIDQGMEHGPIDFFPNPPSGDPDYQCRLAKEGGYSGIVFHIGLAQKYMRDYAGEVPLILKINGKTNVPPDDEAFSAVEATVEDAVRLGADAVGYTLYLGSPAQDRDFIQLGTVRRECDRYGMPLIVWSYPRGSAIEAKGGRDSIYAVDYAARVANELGADIIKLNVPKFRDPRNADSPKPYRDLYEEWKELDEHEAYRLAVEKVVASAGKAMVLFSGGSRISDEDLLLKARVCMEAGATGLIFGRNMWQRPFEEGLRITKQLKEVLLSVS